MVPLVSFSKLKSELVGGTRNNRSHPVAQVFFMGSSAVSESLYNLDQVVIVLIYTTDDARYWKCTWVWNKKTPMIICDGVIACCNKPVNVLQCGSFCCFTFFNVPLGINISLSSKPCSSSFLYEDTDSWIVL